MLCGGILKMMVAEHATEILGCYVYWHKCFCVIRRRDPQLFSMVITLHDGRTQLAIISSSHGQDSFRFGGIDLQIKVMEYMHHEAKSPQQKLKFPTVPEGATNMTVVSVNGKAGLYPSKGNHGLQLMQKQNHQAIPEKRGCFAALSQAFVDWNRRACAGMIDNIVSLDGQLFSTVTIESEMPDLMKEFEPVN